MYGVIKDIDAPPFVDEDLFVPRLPLSDGVTQFRKFRDIRKQGVGKALIEMETTTIRAFIDRDERPIGVRSGRRCFNPTDRTRL